MNLHDQIVDLAMALKAAKHEISVLREILKATQEALGLAQDAKALETKYALNLELGKDTGL